MKSHQEKVEPEFQPVTITLETQHEVNALHALLNHTGVVNAVDLPFEVYNVTKPYRDHVASTELHSKLCQYVRKSVW